MVKLKSENHVSGNHKSEKLFAPQRDGASKDASDVRQITKRSEDYSRWYLDVIAAADLAENSPVRGCMVIKPNGYAIWENIQKILDAMFKATGVRNAYFPLFIPQSFLAREAKHIEGFAKECAVVTHHRLESTPEGVVPAGPLEEPLIVRPTSETIMYHMYAKWVSSYRDLPILLNQWANVVRWEMRTRPFLRTTEFLWQEGHTAHATQEEAYDRTRQMLDIYQKFCEEYLAIPTIPGFKSPSERFAGADETMCIEAMMQDGKALQAGTSHMLGQNFSKPFNVKFLTEKGTEEFAWQTSWGLSTRIIGALIMTHSDDTGLVLPPKIAPTQVIIIPVWKSQKEYEDVRAKVEELRIQLDAAGISVEADMRDTRPGPKFFEWERKGVPVRIEIGPRDIQKKSVVVVRRDNGSKEDVSESLLVPAVQKQLNLIQKSLYDRAVKFCEDNMLSVDTWDDFCDGLKGEKTKFLQAHWCSEASCEAQIKDETKATIRCIPFDQIREDGHCIKCRKASHGRVIFAKAY